MDAKIEPTHGGKGSGDEVSEILKVLTEVRSDLNSMDRKLDKALTQISSLERIVKSHSKQQVNVLMI